MKNGNSALQVTVSPEAKKALLVLCFATILTLHLHAALAPALPNIIRSFNIDIDIASWVLTAYMVSGAVMSIVIGRLADIYGAKKMFIIVMICYTVGISLSSFSEDISTLLALRVLQGLAVAVIPLGSKIVRDVYPDQKYVQAQGILTSMFSVGSVIGLIVGAVILQFLDWHGIFYTAIPFSLIVVFLSWKYLPSKPVKIEEKNKTDGHKRSLNNSENPNQGVDIKGALTLSISLVSLLLSLSLFPYIETEFIEFVSTLVIGLVSLAIFVRIERSTDSPLVDLKIMSHRVIVLGNMVLLTFGIVQYLVFQSIPMLGQTPVSAGGFGLDPIGVGLLQMPFSIAIMILGPVAGIIAAKYGPKKLIIPGAGILVLGFVLLLFFNSTPEMVAFDLTFFGIAAGLLVTLDAIIILFIPKAVMGTSSAVMNTMRIIGGSIGPIIAGVIMQSFQVKITVEGKEQFFPDSTAFTIIFSLMFILSIVIFIITLGMKRKADEITKKSYVS